jgi:hypothetical protein
MTGPASIAAENAFDQSRDPGDAFNPFRRQSIVNNLSKGRS